MPACRTLDTVSVFATTVPDAWSVFRVAAGYDAADAYSRRIAAPPLAAPPPVQIIGVPDAATREFFGDAAQEKSFEDAVALLSTEGAKIVELDFTPFHEVAAMLYDGAWVAERLTVIEELLETNPEAVLPVTRKIIGVGAKLSAADTFCGFYRLAELKRCAEPLIDGVDLLCVPSIPSFCSSTDLREDPVSPNFRLGTYTNFVNLLDLCGIAVPCGPRSDGRPGSVNLLAKAGRDAAAAAVAVRLHQAAEPFLGATEDKIPGTQLPFVHPQPGEIAIAVVDAHMSSLPLNH